LLPVPRFEQPSPRFTVTAAAEPTASAAVRLAVTGRHSGCSLRSMEDVG
jgi:hypothetical protein